MDLWSLFVMHSALPAHPQLLIRSLQLVEVWPYPEKRNKEIKKERKKERKKAPADKRFCWFSWEQKCAKIIELNCSWASGAGALTIIALWKSAAYLDITVQGF